jgi:hypothetical protein
MAGYLPSFDSSTALFRGSGAGVVPYSTCVDTARPGAIRTRKLFKQRGGKCPCMLGGGKRKQSKSRQSSKDQRKQKQRYTRKQKGGAGYTFDMADMLMKEPARVTTPCQMPRPPTQFGGSSNGLNKQSQSQIGGGALVGSPIASMTESIGGTTQPSSALVYPATTAAYSFDLAGSKNLKGIYAAVAPMNGRVGPVSCRSRRNKRKHA